MPSESVLSDNPFDLLNDEEGEGGSDKKDSKAAPKQAERPKTDKRDKAKHGAEPQKNAATVQRGGKGGAATRGGRPVKHDGFDRKSGSGTSERSKRKGNGKYNWGRDVDVVGEDGFTTTNKPSRNPRKKSETVAEQPAAEKPAAEVKQETAPASTEPAAEEAVPEDTTPEFGLEEYRALQLKNRPEGDDKQAREVKIDEKKWKAPVKVLNKEEDAKETKAEAKSTQKRSTENKKLLSLQEFYAITPAAAPAPREQRSERSAPSSSSGEFRGGRGRGRGGRGGGQERAPRTESGAESGAPRGGSERGGRGRGGRGRGGPARGGSDRGRGRGGGQGAPRGGPRKGASVALNDEHAFPKLGGK